MRRRLFVTMLGTALVGPAAAAPAVLRAQEGHPLSGTWTGDWGQAGKRTHLTVVMSWDGKVVTGLINPGPDAIPLGTVSVDWNKWTLRIEAKGVTAEGRIEDIGSAHRRIVGTWAQGGTKGDLQLRRN